MKRLWEGLRNQKPVFKFGQNFYSWFYTVIARRNYHTWPSPIFLYDKEVMVLEFWPKHRIAFKLLRDKDITDQNEPKNTISNEQCNVPCT